MESELLFGPTLQFWTFENGGTDPQLIKSPVAPFKLMEQQQFTLVEFLHPGCELFGTTTP